MQDPLHKKLKAIKETQHIRGIELPVGLEFRQLIVTGPPGAGKSHYISRIRGWPNEGYLDLSRRNWWRDRSLIYRPREIHLGIPYETYDEALAVFDQEWLDAAPESLHIDYQRIRIPPRSHSRWHTDWRDRYIFEFILPDPAVVYEQRLNRRTEGCFPVDTDLSHETVVRQLESYSFVALYLHRAGMNVYVRRNIDEPPLLISEKGDVALPSWAVAEFEPRPSLKTIDGWKQLLFRQATPLWFTVTDNIQDLAEPSRVPHDGKSVDIIIGRLHLRLSPEIPLGAGKRYLRQHKNWLISQPRTCSDKQMRGFARITPGQTIMLGRSNKEYDDLFNFDKEVAKRHVSITNNRGDLIMRPLHQDRPVRIVRLDDRDNRSRLDASRIAAMEWISELLGGAFAQLEPGRALNLLEAVNDILAAEPYRPKDDAGLAGGLLELPDGPVPVIVGDLHGQLDNLLKILTENCLVEALQNDRALLCILGDAVHPEHKDEMEVMDSSILIMDLICALKRRFPANVFYLRGNHDSFSSELAKNAVPQGLLLKKALEAKRGRHYVAAMQRFYDLLPYMAVSPSFIGIHAGPPRGNATRAQIVNLRQHPLIARELTHNRLKRPHYLAGYGKTDIKSLRRTLDAHKTTPVIVGHTPLDPFGSIWRSVGGIKNHHIVYSAHQNGPGLFIRVRGKMVALAYPFEPISRLHEKLQSSTRHAPALT